MTRVTPAIPMTTATTLLEPSFSDLITAIEQANDRPGQQRRHWVCSLRRIARCRNGPGPSLWRRMVAVPRMMTKRGSG
jgi:hypothetical protein